MTLTKKYLFVLFLFTSLYTIVGYLNLPQAPHIPGFIAFFGWGIIAPLLSIALIWISSIKFIAHKATWLWVSILFSAYFVLMGFISLYCIVAVWYTI